MPRSTKIEFVRGIFSPDPPDPPSPLAWYLRQLGRVGFIAGIAIALVAPAQWIYAGYAYASIPCIVAVVRRQRFVFSALAPPIYALVRGGYLPVWTIAALLGGLLPMFLGRR